MRGLTGQEEGRRPEKGIDWMEMCETLWKNAGVIADGLHSGTLRRGEYRPSHIPWSSSRFWDDLLDKAATAYYSDHRDGHSFLDRCDSRRPLLSRWKITMLSSFVLFASRAEISYILKAATSAWELETREGETRTDGNDDDR